jgi:hypothetical protein
MVVEKAENDAASLRPISVGVFPYSFPECYNTVPVVGEVNGRFHWFVVPIEIVDLASLNRYPHNVSFPQEDTSFCNFV